MTPLAGKVEQNKNGVITQAAYAPDGSQTLWMTGQNLISAYVRLPKGATAEYNGSGLSSYWHPDWLGTARLYSTPSRSAITDDSFAPFGEQYQGATQDTFFTGSAQIAEANDLLTFPARNYSPTQGRWLSPDPAGLAAVDLTNPQTLNRYVYVNNNPLGLIDPSGMDPIWTTCPGCSVTVDGGATPYIDFATWSYYYGYPGAIFYANGYCRGCSAGGGGSALAAKPATPPNPGPPPKNGNPIRAFLPSNALTCTGMGRQFFAPPQFSLSKVVAAGLVGGKYNLFAMNRAVGHFGTFDYQRAGTPSNFTFYKGLTPVSNMDVGAYLYGAGFTQSQAGKISNTFADLFSSNAGDPNQGTYRNFGYKLAAGGGNYTCSAIPQ